MLFGLLLGEAALGQALDEPMSVEGDGRGHGPIVPTRPAWDKDTASTPPAAAACLAESCLLPSAAPVYIG